MTSQGNMPPLFPIGIGLKKGQRVLPSEHPFENDPQAQKEYELLLNAFFKKVKYEWKSQFAPYPRWSKKEILEKLQPPLHGLETSLAALEPSDLRILRYLGYGEDPLRSEEAVFQEGFEFLKRLVEIDSQTKNLDGNRRVRELVAKELGKLGAQIEHFPKEGVTIARFRPEKPRRKRVLLLGHTDTVPHRDEFHPSFVYKDGKVFGAGVADMKGGLVIVVMALKGLHQAGLLKDRYITVILNSDEEIGSKKSELLIKKFAKEHDIGFVFESGKITQNKGGGVTLGRKGILGLDVDIFGKTAHSGVAPYEGIDAGKIASWVSVLIGFLTDYEKGITANVGIMETNEGTANNRFIWHVKLGGEIRYWKPEDEGPLKRQVELIVKGAMLCNPYVESDKKICSDYSLQLENRSPSSVTEENKELFLQARALSLSLGLPIDSVTSGGASDQNLLTEAGLKMVIDSWGLKGGELHSLNEWGDWETFLFRVQLVALMIHRTTAPLTPAQ